MTRQEIEGILGGHLEVPERFEPNLIDEIDEAIEAYVGSGYPMCVVLGGVLVGVHYCCDHESTWIDSADELPDGFAVIALSRKQWRRLSEEEYQIERARVKAEWEAR